MPAECLSDLGDVAAQLRSDDALLDRLAAPGAGGDLPIGMKAEQFAAAERGLRLFDRARDEFLHQNFIGERAAGVQLLQRAIQVIAVADEPDAAAGGADRGFDDGRKPDRGAQFAFGCHDPCRRLRQVQSVEQPAEAGLAVRGAITFETRQRQPDAARQPRLHAREQEPLFMGRQQHVILPGGQQSLDKAKEPGGIVLQPRAAMKLPDKPREPRQAERRGIADLDVVTRQPENGDRFPRGSAASLGNQHPERLLNQGGIGHAGSFPYEAALSCRISPFRRGWSGAAMQPYSWTNNRQPVFSARLAGPLSQRGID
jgi:hypothetical protein